MAFFQWLIVSVVAVAGSLTLIDRSPSESREYKIFLGIISCFFVLSPCWFEYASWGDSVPVTFSADGKVTEHYFGLFTVPFVTEYANMPTGGNSSSLVVATVISKDRKRARVLKYDITASIESPNRYYAKMERRQRSSLENLGEFERTTDSTLYAFIEQHPIDPGYFLSESLGSAQRGTIQDSLKNVFNDWLKVYRPNDGGIAISFTRLSQF
jgi:hypothetical protein